MGRNYGIRNYIYTINVSNCQSHLHHENLHGVLLYLEIQTHLVLHNRPDHAPYLSSLYPEHGGPIESLPFQVFLLPPIHPLVELTGQ